MGTEEHLAAARAARRRLWAADVAMHYAQKRFSQTEEAKDRLIWQNSQKESKEASAAVREADAALAHARPALNQPHSTASSLPGRRNE